MFYRLLIVAAFGGLAGLVILWFERVHLTWLNVGLSVLAFLPVGIILFLGWIIHGVGDSDRKRR